MAVSGTRSWKTFSNISDPTQLSDPVASFLIFGLSSTSSYRTAMVGEGMASHASQQLDVLSSAWSHELGPASGKLNLAGANGSRHLFVVGTSVKWVRLRRVYTFLWGKLKKDKGRKKLKVIIRE